MNLALRLEGDRSGDGGLSPKTSEANHCQSAVLQLNRTSTGKLFRGLLGGEAERIVQAGDHVLLLQKAIHSFREKEGERKEGVCERTSVSVTSSYLLLPIDSLSNATALIHHTHLSRNTATEVVSALSPAGMEELVMELNEASKQEHLSLSPARDGIPGLKALRGDGGEVNASCELPGKAEASADGPPSHEGGHGDAAVLDLGVAEPGDGLVRSEVGEAERIPFLAELNGVGLGKNGLAGHAGIRGSGGSGRGRGGFLLGGGLLLGHEDRSGNAGDIGLGSRHEGRGGASKSSKSQERQLHFGYIWRVCELRECDTLLEY